VRGATESRRLGVTDVTLRCWLQRVNRSTCGVPVYLYLVRNSIAYRRDSMVSSLLKSYPIWNARAAAASRNNVDPWPQVWLQCRIGVSIPTLLPSSSFVRGMRPELTARWPRVYEWY
jgi:hypothetical protein